MGEHKGISRENNQARTAFIQHLLNDIRALELMLAQNLIESDINRIGSEQEFCLVTDNWRPAKNAGDILRTINDDHFTTELARYNLEINLDPVELKGNCFTQMEAQLRALLKKANVAAAQHGSRVVTTGILPTISKNELEFDYMTPNPRYWALNDVMKELRGADFNLYLTGVDDLFLTHDSVLFEACNTSFQMHLQVSPDDFIASYNWAQAIAGPVLGLCTNSPLLLGRELWSETRIALFRQSIDSRSSSYALKDQQARVTFGDSWATGTIADIFKNEIARYKVLLFREIDTHSLEELEKGNMPKLQALMLHNGTIYRWNRACYGVGGGKAHVRLENRYIPSGPTISDEMANFTFWVGLMMGRPPECDDLPAIMDFRDAKSNFIKAARTGKESVLHWMGRQISVRDLALEVLLPMAWDGLRKAGIDEEDISRSLNIIEQRAASFTGSQWTIRNYRRLRAYTKQDDALVALTRKIYENQQANTPVHQWPPVDVPPEAPEAAHLVGHIMSTQLFTVNRNDLAELAVNVMRWKNIHHVPVEDKTGKLCGMLTWTHMKRFQERKGTAEHMIVADIMAAEVYTVSPETAIKDAIKLMKQKEIGSLPVVQGEYLIGIITIKDVIPFDHD